MEQRKPDGGEGFAARIRKARKDAGINQRQLSELLGMSRNTVAGWETGHSRPDLDSVPALCRALRISLASFFGVREGVTRAERKMLDAFRALGKEDQDAIQWQLEALVAGRQARGRAPERAAEGNAAPREPAGRPAGPVRAVSVYMSDLSAAAGVGTTLDAARGEQVWLRQDELTSQADEIITVNGRSMEPTFEDGDQLLVRHADSVREGEIGIFVADGEGYVKEYRADGLHSHNPAYATMRFGEGNEVRCIGRVLGKVQESQRLTKDELRWMEENQ
jgi:phage repressor protein C with HTH and peptisase S24 domain